MSETIRQEELNRILWQAADSSRTSLDASVYKDYVLVMLFFKYLSDLSKKQHQKYQARFGNDEERIQEKMKCIAMVQAIICHTFINIGLIKVIYH